jgi:hypothetical protein
MRMTVRVDAANAPAIIDAQLTADEEDSVGAAATAAEGRGDCIVELPYRMNSMSRMMIGIGTPRSQSKIPRPISTS